MSFKITTTTLGVPSNIHYDEITSYLQTQRETINKSFDILNFIDTKQFIHRIRHFIEPVVCRWIVYESEKYADHHGGWTTRRHANFPTTDLPICRIQGLNIWLHNLIILNIFPIIETKFKFNKHYLSISDLFVVKYEIGKQEHLEFHRDGSIISFNILLNSEKEFNGGGTIIKHLQNKPKTYHINQGDLLLHYGIVDHSGGLITNGTRYILVGFINFMVDYKNRNR